ncbi:MAG: outer membrane protein assembly factor BamD [Saprospiraceae bacterium]|nr:outer membrane protein assembly factor BamD [Saprospiraceae bacterium]MCB0624894.1 outer membrane protein assembly factor BamD [Saprospiraceae bacterium]MCB0677804.1 outer membrane protein assembly factor BamD [Saprospiraceae bacterium]MCB0682582.1 outer membrane protein assembly factor BamD [Saprospiraceae bacterium]
MNRAAYFGLIASLLLALAGAGCKSEFEKIRASGDNESIYKEAMKFYEEGEFQKAQTLFELVIGSFRGRPELEDIYFKYAYTYYYLEKYVLAAYYFKNFSNTFPTNPLRQEADFMTAYSNYRLSPSFRLDQTYTQSAIDEFQLFVNTYPESERVEECNLLIDQLRQKLERKAYATGELYFDLRQYQAATQTFENLLKDFPETDNSEYIRYMIVRSAFLLADNSIFEKQRERYQTALDYATDFLEKYQDSKYLSEVQTIFDQSSNKLNSFTDGGYKNQSAGAGS